MQHTNQTRQLQKRSEPQTPSTLCSAQLPLAAQEIAESVKYLCSMKRTVELTPHQVQTWLAVLGVFDVAIVNRALLKIGLSADPFPDLGKIVQECEVIRKEATTYADKRLPAPSPLIKHVADALRLRIEPDHGPARGFITDSRPKE